MSNSNPWPVMGNGNVAIGTCRRAHNDDTPGLIYLKLDAPRVIGSNTSDVYPPGKATVDDNILACVYFKTAESVQQTIDVLLEMKRDRF
jgi:hypothetical protein